MKLSEGQKRIDKIIQEEMLVCGDAMRKARTFAEWELAHNQLNELGRVADTVMGKTPNMESASHPVVELFRDAAKLHLAAIPEIEPDFDALIHEEQMDARGGGAQCLLF